MSGQPAHPRQALISAWVAQLIGTIVLAAAVMAFVRGVMGPLTSGDTQQSTELLNPTIATIDKAVNKGILHKNTAARYKSRLTRHVNNLSQ